MSPFTDRFGYSVLKDGYESGAIFLDETETKAAVFVLNEFLKDVSRKQALEHAFEKLARHKSDLSKNSASRIRRFAISETSGFSFLENLLHDGLVEDISVSEGERVRVYLRKRGWTDCNVAAAGGKKLVDLANKMARPLGRRLTLRQPVLNASLQFGRLHAVMPPVSARVELSIRRFNISPFSPPELVELKTVSAEAMAFLWLCVQSDCNMLLCGNTGSGKTSLLNALLSFIRLDERVICIEETPELKIPQKNHVRLVAQAGCGTKDLVTASLRMRPDRI
ncbi:CpaF family protein, partial [archaeon]|nr:CpaF family protein [archaeon]